jgi:peptidoglycan/LPS O-acetylase OafA/YrhL
LSANEKPAAVSGQESRPLAGEPGRLSLPRRIPELDGVRGIAILLVVTWHYWIAQVINHQPPGVAGAVVRSLYLTWSGVDLFFVLSGFLIGGILLDNREAPHYFKAFYARRVCRIFPLYFLCLGLFAALYLLCSPLGGNPGLAWLLARPMPAWSYLTFTQNLVMAARGDLGCRFLSITWSLGVEEQFYLLLPFVIRFLPRRWLPAAFAAMAAVGPALRFAMDQRAEVPRFTIMPCRLDSLMLGVLCAWLLRHEASRRWLTRHLGLLYAAFALLAGGKILLYFRPRLLPAVNLYPLRYSWLAAVYAVFLLLAVVEGTAGGGPVAWLTRSRALRRVGALAYCLYMVHQAVFGLAYGLLHREPGVPGASDVAVIFGALLVSLGLAAVSWRWFEKPILALGHRVSYAGPVPGEAALAAAVPGSA